MGRFESGKIFWKLLLPERQKKRVGKRQEGLKVEKYFGKYSFRRGRSGAIQRKTNFFTAVHRNLHGKQKFMWTVNNFKKEIDEMN